MIKSSSDKRYFYSLDAIRGVAALLVAMRHSSDFFGNVVFQESYLAVDVFFVLSGVVIENAYEQRLMSNLSAGRFLWLRIIRLYPLYILGTAIMLVACALGYQSTSVSFVALAVLMLPNLRQWQQYYPLNTPAWSLFFELVANAFYGKYVLWLTSRRITLIMAASAVCLAYFVARDKSLDIGYVARDTAGLFRVAYSFSAGLLLYRLFASRKRNVQHNALMFLAIPALVGIALTQSPSPAFRPYYDLLIVFVGFPAIVYTALWIEPTGAIARVCKFLGATSYALYALHMPAGVLVKGLLTRAGIDPHAGAPWVGFAFIAALLALCWLIDMAYDMPVRRFLTKSSSRKAVGARKGNF